MKFKSTQWLCMSLMVAWSGFALAQDIWDTDGDGFDDNNDNCTLVHNELQRDTDGDSFGNMCDADFNGDGQINFLDLSYLSQRFLTTDPDADINGDGSVNFVDIALFGELFMTVPGPTGTDPEQPPCTCYFSGDCPSGTFCNYGPGSFATEDICVWRDIKPFGVIGAGCSIESNLTTGDWIPDICDGVCTSSTQGSAIGLENTDMVAEAMMTWGQAMIDPSAAGGGPVDPVLAERANALPFSLPTIPIQLGRYAADALAMAAGEPFHDYFCHYEGHPEDPNQPVVNLANDPCRVTSGQLTIQALASELKTPGTARAIMEQIPEACPKNWQSLFITECDAGPGALNCAIQYIESQAQFLRTPSVGGASPAEQNLLDQLMGAAGR
ncbi:MAG: dockerin type I domain-containing protein [Pseudomonadota bacterium]